MLRLNQETDFVSAVRGRYTKPCADSVERIAYRFSEMQSNCCASFASPHRMVFGSANLDIVFAATMISNVSTISTTESSPRDIKMSASAYVHVVKPDLKVRYGGIRRSSASPRPLKSTVTGTPRTSVWPSPRQTPGPSWPHPSDRPPSGHRPGRRRARHAHLLQIGFLLVKPRSMQTSPRHSPNPRIPLKDRIPTR